MIKKGIRLDENSNIRLNLFKDLCKECIKFKCKIDLYMGKNRYNVKSFLSLLNACVKNNDYIEIQCDGVDERQAMKCIIEIFEKNLGDLGQ